MAKGCEDQEGFAENFREKLGFAVRNIEWCYAIFWSISSSQPGVLEWGDGYYNGDIKTRKTVQATEISPDLLGLQRTEHLRELYDSLLAAEANTLAKIHPTALSPEDLTDTEWYFLVCMSFVFNVGQGLPGKALSKNQSIWLCNAHQADSRIFTRSLLAKSASVQTVVCFPYLGGIIELGATDLVLEDLNLIHHIRTSYLDIPHAVGSKVPNYVSSNGKNDKDIGGREPDEDKLDLCPVPPVECEDNNNIGSPYNNSNGFGANQEEGDSFMVEEMIGEASQLQSWKLADDDISNCIHNSTNSSDCISQNYVNPERVSTLSDAEKLNGDSGKGVDVHYQSILSNVLKSSHQLVLGPHFRNNDRESSFVTWKKETSSKNPMPRTRTRPQRLLKKVLCGSHKQNDHHKPEADETDKSRVLSERRRREKLNERFTTLASLIPTSGKVDKISILDETIEYLRDLERRVRNVEPQKERLELEARSDNAERISDNCCAKSADKGKNVMRQKRKVSDMEENSRGKHKDCTKNGSGHDVTVSMISKDVTIEMKCQWSEGMLMKIVQVLNNLHLDCHGIQSSNSDGILSVTIKAKMEGTKAISMSLIRLALQKLIQAS
ncbi:PREDICTED: transcription factor EGL1-like [Ipomoea nil]|uniref:BHLH transcriptional regulator n=1 Tax=Ipomoea nil TaxID=35883 RepID=Q1JV06_IPONI|nr:PREDICTED: transcription factor EGL1-like [Ipomoea nil]XP_019195789.1 PREDICTED: transcription factor EGL1-like [Ipomoea nil]XP_019195790.1 PREDICTED: transcription factor EGL1-like [Ipomoea nil]BAE94395.1 bHLH transcriptional regulator [Ipomoea nil]